MSMPTSLTTTDDTLRAYERAGMHIAREYVQYEKVIGK